MTSHFSHKLRVKEQHLSFYAQLSLVSLIILSSQAILTCGCSITDDSTGFYHENPYSDEIAHPSWSPTGEWIAFSYMPEVGDGGIDIIHPDGSGRRQVLPRATWPSWSSDGIKIAACYAIEGQIYYVDINTNEISQITSSPHAKLFPSWRPNANTILYSVLNPDSAKGLWEYDLDSKTSTRLVSSYVYSAHWNSDALSIVAIRPTIDTYYVSRLDSPFSSYQDLLSAAMLSVSKLDFPSFIPKQTKILFSSSGTSIAEPSVWTYDVLSKRTNRIVSGGHQPSWSPIENKMAFVRRIFHSNSISGNGQLWIIDFDTHQEMQVTGVPPD